MRPPNPTTTRQEHPRRDGHSARRGWESPDLTIVGFILVAFGMLALIYGGISSAHHKASLDVVPSRATAMAFKPFRHSPLLGGIALISGLLLLVVPRNLPSASIARARRGGHLNDTSG